MLNLVLGVGSFPFFQQFLNLTISQGVRDCDVFVPSALTPQDSEELIYNFIAPALSLKYILED